MAPTRGGTVTEKIPLYKRHSPLLPLAMRARLTFFWARQPHDPAVWLALLHTKAGDVKTNPGPTNTLIWICDVQENTY